MTYIKGDCYPGVLVCWADPAIALKRIGNNDETYLIAWKMIAILVGRTAWTRYTP